MTLHTTYQLKDFWLRFSVGGYGLIRYPFLRYELSDAVFDKASGLQVHVEGFDAILSDMNIPVLALFGKKDMNIDWRNVKRLYERTIEPNLLTLRSFPNCNHNIFEAKTGGYYEFQDNQLAYKRCSGFIETASKWLKALNPKTNNHSGSSQ